MVNKQEFRAAMIRNGDRQEDLAKAIGLTTPTLSDKMNGKADFWRKEIEAISVRYSLSAEDIVRIFFPKAVA